ncbi:CoA-transferase family III [Colletotrichum cereale]|nr:CoA-transferase family III [Colletotrichum cereale]
MDRSTFSPTDIVRELWTNLGLPKHAASAVRLEAGPGPAAPSSFKIGHIAQSSIALSALTAALLHSHRNGVVALPRVAVPLRHAFVEFRSERLYEMEGDTPKSAWGDVGGLHRTLDGHTTGTERGLAIYALRTYEEWDSHPQSASVADQPILPRKLADGPGGFPEHLAKGADRCLRGLRVPRDRRAAPVAGKTLAAHGADVLWVTSPNLPDQPPLDREFARGKRTIRLDIDKPPDKAELLALLRTADVFVQGCRPGSLAARGLSPAELAAANPRLIVANLSAFGPDGPWSGRRGFESLVQTCSGMNVSEARHHGAGEPARPLPCRALDHGAGYLLAAGISAALYRRATEGGSWIVDVSLAGVMEYLRSLGQYPGRTGFEASEAERSFQADENLFEKRMTGFGVMKYLRHSAAVEGLGPGWDVMPKPLGSDEPRWLT